ncbi:ATP-binding protein [Psychrobacter submarinus]|uniref:ATP-binding protein n=1 Tax=Psychrobacter submarinus TaxID=154108 RepID=UPI001918F184|nr:DUF87 domain-containing protein [Psychrobacter submarinus]
MTNQIALATKTEAELIQQQAFSALQDASNLINKSYLSELRYCDIVPRFNHKINLSSDVRVFKVERIVLENKQSVLESMTAAYNALGAAGFSVFIFLDCDGSETHLYLGARGQSGGTQGGTAGQLLQETFKGHFSGSELLPLNGSATQTLMNNLYSENNDGTSKVQSVTAVTGVPSLSVEEREHFMQGLERFIDAAEGHNYSAVILAEPVTPTQLSHIRSGYESVSTQLSPLLKQQVSYGENDSEAMSLSISHGLSQSLSDSLSQTETSGVTEGTNTSKAYGTSESLSEQTNKSKVASFSGTAITLGATIVGGAIGNVVGAGIGSMIGSNVGRMISDPFTENKTAGTSYTESQGINEGTSFSSAAGRTTSESSTNSETTAKSDTQTVGTSRQLTLDMTDKSIEQMLKKIDKQLERVDEASRYGGWQTAAYFIGNSTASSETLASIFLGLMRGGNSDTEDFALTTWDKSNNIKMRSVLEWLKLISHPRLNASFFNTLPLKYLTPATLVSGKEMAIQLSMPRRSTSSTAVVETQAFGRQVKSLDGHNIATNGSIELGVIRHLWNDLPQKVSLDIDNLTSHVFISGSTGSGKSNTVYEIMSQLQEKNIPFLVIEPTKGEYKHIFGYLENVNVFSTNPSQAPLLKINPFKFPKSIHVLEHIDRLVEIFNVCWSMYAAMPAVLKDAILQAYEASGWDINNSYNYYSEDIFPTFNDLLEAVNNVINTSAYSDEVKSNYVGSLATRVKSLTNGLNGQIFASYEIDNNILFDSNVIIDLSRVGSQETKSLIMGILIMRLNERRMAFSGMNQPLKHVTILEEAHHLLKRTSTEQSSEGSNVTGKAVEMLSNSIAEMRTYGEGFLIIDQSPSAVDSSAIRNTNTKIILRLPDEQDRRLIGKAAVVNDDQLEEIARLPRGVAVIYQNNWLEPVLCKINFFNGEEKEYKHSAINQVILSDKRKEFNLHLARLLLHKRMDEKEPFDLQILKDGAKKYNIATNYKIGLLNSIQQIEKTGHTTIWSDHTNAINLLFSVLGIRETISSQLTRMSSKVELNVLADTLLKNHLTQLSDNMTRSIHNDLSTAWKNSSKDMIL